jgi:hypothetical protein
MVVQDSNDVIYCILVALTEIRSILQRLVSIAVKPVFILEVVTLSSSSEEICRHVCKSPIYVQIFV